MSTWTVGTEIGVAIGTLGLAGVASALVWRTGDLAKLMSEAIRESTRQAKATEEQAHQMQRDREAAHQPVLSVTLSRDPTAALDAAQFVDWIAIRNAGGGAAIGVRLLRVEGQRWGLSPSIDVQASGASDTFLLRPESQEIPWELLEATEFGQAHTKPADMVIFCADLLGRRFRFVVTDGEKCRFTYPAEIWCPGTEGAPSWVTDPRLWAS
jgi:hypothetical protein